MASQISDKWAFGVAFSQVDLDEVTRLLAARDPLAPFAYVATPNAVHVVHMARHDPRFVQGVNGAWLRTCDSRIVSQLARITARRSLKLALGSDLTVRLFESVIQPADAISVIGGDAELAGALRDRFRLRDLALHAPPFGFIDVESEVQRCIAFVREHPSRFVFLACGAPQSEVLARRLRDTPGLTGVGLCIGASLLFLTGRVRRAPRAVQRLGLEWLYRLAAEPRRLAPRLIHGQLPMLLVALRYLIDPRLRATHQPRAARVSEPEDAG